MNQAQGYAFFPVQPQFRPTVPQPLQTPLRATFPPQVQPVARVPMQCTILASPAAFLYRPVAQAPIQFQVQRPLVITPTTSRVNSIATLSSSLEHDSGVAFMDVSDPSLRVDVSLSLPSSPSASNCSAASPLPTSDDLECGEDLDTAFDDRDFDSIISSENHITLDACDTNGI